jgi:hypothetical protein
MAHVIPDNATITKNSSQMSAIVDGEAVIMSLQTGHFHGATGAGVRIWTLLDAPQTLESLLKSLCDEFDVDLERCRPEVEAFLASLLERQLVEVRSE